MAPHRLTASQSTVFPFCSGPEPAAEPVGRPLRRVAVTGRVAPRQGMAAAPAGGHSETGTPGTDCARHYSKGGEEEQKTLKKQKKNNNCILKCRISGNMSGHYICILMIIF